MPQVFSAENDGYKDDINFSALNPNLGLGDKANNIVKIIYGGKTVYEQGKTELSGGSFITGTENDNLVSAQKVNLNLTLPSNARDANLYITYKTDGACEKISTSLARCTKTYIQESSELFSTTWHDSSKIFKLPSYADTSSGASVIVKIGGVVIPEDVATWTKHSNPNQIVFANSFSLFQNQTIEIIYFVSSNSSDLTKLKSSAQEKINSICSCATGSKCNLKPIMDSNNSSIINYECSYPTSVSEAPPVNQTVYVSNKNTAHRFFDKNGVNYDSDYSAALDQELNAFSYTNNDLLRPNNNSQYIGFNEIYGSYGKGGTYNSRSAKTVSVKKDRLYDILVSSGSFSTCLTCGTDYYTGLQKIFPQNFMGQGGGYTPDNYNSKRENSTSMYRSDDLHFGRACFVPATMIPWTHSSSGTVRDQRRARLSAQHFLFANGYNRDWYGFDYGSLIGSFDGVSWFSIGNQRRIKAGTGKLYLSVNAYLGDLNSDNNFTVTVSESSSYTSEIADHDTESDGAECQKSHYCSNDNDCFRQLGYDYICNNVVSLYTNWPQFDSTGSEIIGSNLRSLLSIVGGSNGQSKRCIFRGRGAPCLQNLNTSATATTFNGSSVVGTLTCSHNNSCLPLTTSDRFNDRIARFGNTPISQNTAEVSTTKSDTVGLGARIILRPFDYYGTKSVPESARTNLTSNNIFSICVPGRDLNSATDTFDLNFRHPTNRIESSDKLFGVGPASALSMSTKALNSCPATDELGISLLTNKQVLGNSSLNSFSISQNMSSNLLDLAPLRNLQIYSSTNGSLVTSVGYQKNACLRAPGASCFSDMECAPSGLISSKVKSANLLSVLNSAEIKFWEEELVCGNPEFKYVSPGVLNSDFSIKKNKCCREYGKTLTVHTQTNNSTHQWCDTNSTIKVAGVNQSINHFSRYSRVHTVYDKMTCDRTQISSTKSFALSLAADNPTDRMNQILGQYKTLDTLNQRTCCTNHWVRSFSSDNGGGHAFSKSKLQIIDKTMFKNISWSGDNATAVSPDPDSSFECGTDQYLNASCEIKSLTPMEEENYLTWAGSLELIGIPQVAIKTTSDIYQLVDNSQNDNPGANLPLTDSEGRLMMKAVIDPDFDFRDGLSKKYYSASNYDKMNMTSTNRNELKKIFSESEFNCCIPSGQELTETTVPAECCTGFSAGLNGVKRCCLPDFTDITLYLNRYVSSEGRGLPDSAYDQATGYIKDPGQVRLMAEQKNLCCSGTVMTGVAISQLPIPLTGGTYRPPNSSTTVRRFNYRTDDVDNNGETGSVGAIFDAGVRWNNHVYCVPAGLVKQ